MTENRQAHETLCSALQDYARADTEAKRELAILSLHGGLDKTLRAYLESRGFTDVDSRSVSYPDLVNLVRDNTPLFAGDANLPRLLVSLNNTRNRIAHPEPDSRPSPDEISRDAKQYVNLARRFWPEIFDEAFPEALLSAPAEPTPTPKPAPPPPVSPPDRSPPRSPRWPRIQRFLRQLWSDETTPRLQKRLLLRRVIGIIIFLALARLCKEAAIFTARWPEPIKYGGIVLFVLAMASFAWGLILIWKVLRQIRLKGILIFFAVTYILLLSAVVLTSTNSLPWYQEAWQTTREWAGLAGRAVVDTVESVFTAPEEFRVAYIGYRRPVRVPGMDADDPTHLTPIPANRPARLPAGSRPTVPPGQPTLAVPGSTAVPGEEVNGPLPLPACPHLQARLTAPRVGQVIQDRVSVRGTASIDGFDYYKFEYRQETNSEDTWHWIASFKTPVDGGLLGTWDVAGLPAGIYTLRLTVVNTEGNYPYPPCEVTVQIAPD